MFKSITDYLHLKDVGSLEILFAFFLILSRYRLSFIPFSLLVPIVMICIVWARQGVKLRFLRPITYFLLYYIIHQIVWFFIMKSEASSSFLNSTLANTINILIILIVGYELDLKKLIGSLNWVALLSMAGMVYQFLITYRGGEVRPLDLPFFSALDSGWKLKDADIRPMSFYSEPAEYVMFMILPLFFSMIEKKYIWAGAIVFTIFLSSSTTGIALSFLMVAFFVLTQKQSLWVRLVSIGAIGLMAIILMRSDIFSQGVEKIENTDIETSVRMVQGPLVVSHMQGSDYILGVPYADVYDYCVHTSAGNDVVFYDKAVYTATFWTILLLYGVIGLLFYLNMYVYFFRHNKLLRPFVLCLFAIMFSSTTFIGPLFSVQFSVMLAFHRQYLMRESNQQSQTIFLHV